MPSVTAVPGLPTGRTRTLALGTLFLASFMDLLDGTIVNVALPRIEASLGARGPELQWMVAAYALAFAVGLITGSRLGDTYGRKRLFVAGLSAFTLCSALCGLAPTPEMLVAARALQGLAAAAMIPQVMASLQVMYRPSERAAGLAGFSAMAGIAAVSGPVLGAVLTSADIAGLGWRAIFLVNVPVGVVAVAAAVRLVPESTAPRASRLDLGGAGTLTAGLVAVLVPLTVGAEAGWPAWTFASMLAGVAVLAGFVAVQRRKEARDDAPLVSLSLFRGRSFAAGLALLALFFAPTSGFFLVQTLFLQRGLEYTVLRGGLVMLPFALTVPVLAGLSGTVLVKRMGRAVLQLGAVVTAAGFLVLAWSAHQAGDGIVTWRLLAGLAVVGAGFGLLIGPVGTFVLGEVPVRHAGSASGLFNMAGQLAAAVGVAAMGAVFLAFLDRPSTAAGQAAQFAGAYVPTLLVMAATVLLAGVAACFLPRHPVLDDALATH